MHHLYPNDGRSRSGIPGHLRHLQRPPSPHRGVMHAAKQSRSRFTPMRIRVSRCRDDTQTIYRILLKDSANARLYISAPGWTGERALAGLILEAAQAAFELGLCTLDEWDTRHSAMPTCIGARYSYLSYLFGKWRPSLSGDADHSTLAGSIRARLHEIRAGKIEIIAPWSSWPNQPVP